METKLTITEGISIYWMTLLDEVLLIKKLEYEGWRQLKDAGRRWIAEIVFSSI
jgi:hypothetical protein